MTSKSHYLGFTPIFCETSSFSALDGKNGDYAHVVDTSQLTTRAAPKPSPLQTVDRALAVLLSFNETRTEWGVFELAEELGLTKSSAQRILAALASKGFLRVDPYTRRYSLGAAMWRMAALWERSGGLAKLATIVLSRLSEETSMTAAFSVPDGNHVRCIAAVDGVTGPIRAHTLIGDLYPAHAGATSRAYFAFLSPAERRSLLYGRPLAKFSDLTEVDEQRLELMFAQTVADGYALSEGEYDASTRALAVPVLLGRRTIGSLTVTEIKALNPESSLESHLPSLLASAEEISDMLANRTVASQRGQLKDNTH